MGLGAYSVHVIWAQVLGTATTTAGEFIVDTNTRSTVINTAHFGWAGTGNELIADVDDIVGLVTYAAQLTNACWTVVMPYVDADAAAAPNARL